MVTGLYMWSIWTCDKAHFPAGEDSGCALGTDATLWCWGATPYGQTGTGSFAATSAPAQTLTTVGDLTTLTAGSGASFVVIRQDDTLCSWGKNDKFSVGAGGARTIPAEVIGGPVWAH